jgi:hypothetical protein
MPRYGEITFPWPRAYTPNLRTEGSGKLAILCPDKANYLLTGAGEERYQSCCLYATTFAFGSPVHLMPHDSATHRTLRNSQIPGEQMMMVLGASSGQ